MVVALCQESDSYMPRNNWQEFSMRLFSMTQTYKYPMTTNTVYVCNFSHKRKEFNFFSPYKLSFFERNGCFIHENEELGILVQEESKQEMLKAFYDYFSFLWEDYAEADPQNLTKGAITLKNKLLAMCEVM